MRSFSESELALIAQHNLTPEEVDAVLTMFPQNLDTAIGYIMGLKAGMGQVRNEPMQ